MRVYMIGGKYMGCNYVRVILPQCANGFEGNFYGLTTPSKPYDVVSKEILDADVVVFHRPELVQHHMVGMKLREMGKKIVFDNDDTFKFDEFHPFFELDKENYERNKEMKNNVINNFVLNADLVTCSTDFLKKEYGAINPNTIVLPNCVNPMDWDEPERQEGKVRIGFVGSVVYSHDFEIIRDTIIKLSKRDDVQLVVFGLNDFKKKEENVMEREVMAKEYEFWEKLDIIHVPWVAQYKYFRTLNELKLDMMLIPRRENDFNRAKSNVKFLEAAMCEIPVIASSFSDKTSPYDKDIDGENGLLVERPEDWYDAVIELVEDKKKRRAMGKKAYEYTIENYHINKHADKWLEAYKSLL